MGDERGQATVEWVGLILLSAVALGALGAVLAFVDGRSYGGFLSQRIVCAIRGSACPDGTDRSRLVRAYGSSDADLVRRFAPDIVYEPGERQVPVDFRDCRTPECAHTPDDRDLDVHTTDHGRRVTVFTRVVHRGGRTYIQYWFYYPDSNTTWLASDRLWRATPGLNHWPYRGFHHDDWEGYQVRLDRDGRAAVRATSHGHYQWCKQASCENRWGPRTGWTRVTRGSHAGHIPLDRHVKARSLLWAGPINALRGDVPATHSPRIPGVNLHERTSTAEGNRLVPLESLPKRGYRSHAEGIDPPWRKGVYHRPESRGS